VHHAKIWEKRALRTGIAAASGGPARLQDADLEYDPADYPQLLRPLLTGKAMWCMLALSHHGRTPVLYFWHWFGNAVLTLLC